MNRFALLDTNLLLLLLVGTASRRHIRSNKRLSKYDEEAFKLLIATLASAEDVVTTPNILAETSNLLGDLSASQQALQYQVFGNFIRMTAEIHQPARTIVDRKEFSRLGVTDSTLLTLACGDPERLTIVTDDLDLYLAASHAELNVVNFTHIRNL